MHSALYFKFNIQYDFGLSAQIFFCLHGQVLSLSFELPRFMLFSIMSCTFNGTAVKKSD